MPPPEDTPAGSRWVKKFGVASSGAKKIAAHLLEVAEGDLEWEVDRFTVKGNPSEAKTMKEICMVSHTSNPPRHGAGPECSVL